MIQLNRILFPTDFSENSKFAQEYACALSEHFQAELHVLHVLEEIALVPPPPASFFSVPKVSMDKLRDDVQQALAQIPDPAWTRGKRVVHATRLGAPFVEIVRYARENEIDLIVLGTHGRTGLKHVLMGSVAENVVRKATCPVLTIRPTNHKFVMP